MRVNFLINRTKIYPRWDRNSSKLYEKKKKMRLEIRTQLYNNNFYF